MKLDKIFIGPEPGVPGVAIYKEGDKLGAVVSNGTDMWDLAVAGAAPTGTAWSNVALRWKDPSVKKVIEGKASKQGGLELLVNGKSVGHLIYPKHVDGEPDVREQHQIMIGCHMTPNNQTPRGFAPGSYEELAVWDRQLDDSELTKLMGGYDEDLISLPADELLDAIGLVNVTELYQAEMAGKLVTSIINNKYDTVYNAKSIATISNSANSNTNKLFQLTDDLEGSSLGKTKKRLEGLIKVTHRLTDACRLPSEINQEEFDIRFETAIELDEVLNPEGQFKEAWEEIHRDNSHPGSQPLMSSFLSFFSYLTQWSTSEGWAEEDYKWEKSGFNTNFGVKVLRVGNHILQEMSLHKTLLFDHVKGYFYLPDWNEPSWDKKFENWGVRHEPSEKVYSEYILYNKHSHF